MGWPYLGWLDRPRAAIIAAQPDRTADAVRRSRASDHAVGTPRSVLARPVQPLLSGAVDEAKRAASTVAEEMRTPAEEAMEGVKDTAQEAVAQVRDTATAGAEEVRDIASAAAEEVRDPAQAGVEEFRGETSSQP